MARKNEGGRASKGRGTKQERKAARRAQAQDGSTPTLPRRNDRASAGEGKRKLGPRPVHRSQARGTGSRGSGPA
jgi:hypothetical protein